MSKARSQLLFIDTNILLDFYRVEKGAGLSLLNRIDGLHDRIITSYQVEMEFKKNRQKVILQSLNSLKAPEAALAPPAFLSETKTVNLMNKRMLETKARVSKLKERIKKNLEKPSTTDPVYKVAQRLYSNSLYNLKQDSEHYNLIYQRAWQRFILGYPPRKATDTSMGDAMNWEWIIHCAEKSGHDVIIVSRDTDYGLILNNISYVNDWLAQEFKKRVNQQRKIQLVDRLSTALKIMEIQVPKEEEEEEYKANKTPNFPINYDETDAPVWLFEIITEMMENNIKQAVEGFSHKASQGKRIRN